MVIDLILKSPDIRYYVKGFDHIDPTGSDKNFLR